MEVRGRMRIAAMILAVLCALVLSAGAEAPAGEGTDRDRYEKAQELLSGEKYDEAAEIFGALGSYEDAASWSEYCRGMSETAKHNYYSASRIFDGLDNFQDSRMRMKYVDAECAEYQGDYETARDIYEMYSSYLDFAQRASYMEGAIAERDGKRTEAYRIFSGLIPFRDSEARARSILDGIHEENYQAAVSLAAEGRYEEARSAFLSLIPYKDSMDRAESMEERIREEKYAEALSLLQEEKMEEARALFEELGDYRDSAEKVKALEVTRYADSVTKLTGKLYSYVFHDKIGLMNMDRNVVTSARWDMADATDPDSVFVTENGLYGLLNAEGEELIPPTYDLIRPFDSRDTARTLILDKWGLISREGKVLIEPAYHSIGQFDEFGRARTTLNGKMGLINTEGTVLLEPEYDEITAADGNGLAVARKDGQKALILKDGSIGKRTWQEIGTFAEGAAPVQENGLWGYIRDDGTVLREPEYQAAEGFSEGLAAVKKDGKWGWLNKDGQVAIDFMYDQAGSFREGWADVYAEGLGWNMVNPEGKRRYVDDARFTGAEEAMAEGRWLEAAEGFELFPGDSVAAYLAKKARYTLAAEQEKARNYRGAVQNYELAGDYLDAGEKLAAVKAVYEEILAEEKRTANDAKIKAMTESGDFDGALKLLESADIHGDREEKIRSVKYKKAWGLTKEKDFEGASAIFAELGDYQGSDVLYLETMRYLADQLTDRGEYDRALTLYQEYTDGKALREKSGESEGLLQALNGWRRRLKAGDKVQLGRDQNGEPLIWVVLERSGSVLTVISEQSVGKRTYVQGKIPRTWDRCKLRSWLNGDFLTESFDLEERGAIQVTKVQAVKTRESRLITGKNTRDHVYLLNEREVVKYGSILKENPLEELWWTRSPGRESSTVLACKVDVMTLVSTEPWQELGVRPVMNVKDSAFFMPGTVSGE